MITRLIVLTVISFCSVLTHMACHVIIVAVKQVCCCYYRTCSAVVFVFSLITVFQTYILFWTYPFCCAPLFIAMKLVASFSWQHHSPGSIILLVASFSWQHHSPGSICLLVASFFWQHLSPGSHHHSPGSHPWWLLNRGHSREINLYSMHSNNTVSDYQITTGI